MRSLVVIPSGLILTGLISAFEASSLRVTQLSERQSALFGCYVECLSGLPTIRANRLEPALYSS